MGQVGTDRLNWVVNTPPVILLINLVIITGVVFGIGQFLCLIAHITVWMGIY